MMQMSIRCLIENYIKIESESEHFINSRKKLTNSNNNSKKSYSKL